MSAVEHVTNLFPYLVAEEQHRDHQVEEALFLTFNVDLGYFETRLLGLLRATGARITVVADAGVWSPDTRAVKHAGRAYHLGLVEHATAFHPKLMVLAGPKRVTAAVGSGNLTIGGWQYNRELLTVFAGDLDGLPVAFRDIRDALSALATSVAVDPVTARALDRTVRRLSDMLDAAPAVDTGHRVHPSWLGPLIDHLPAGPVGDLLLSAAFHDPDAGAVRSMLARIRPDRVRVAVQPGWTHVDAAALDRVLTEYATRTGALVELLQDAESLGTKAARYRHGKLIEWVTVDGVRRAMTGSPNLTSVALLRRGGAGGNLELAVSGPIPDSLFPAGERVDPSLVPVLVADQDASAKPAAPLVRVLSAVITNDQLTVSLSRPAPTKVAIEGAQRDDHPDDWELLSSVQPGGTAVTLAAALPAGSRVRASTAEGGPTAAVFVTDERRVLMRAIPEKRGSRVRIANASDLFGDDLELLNLLQSDLAAYVVEERGARLPSGARDDHESPDVERHGGGGAIEPWLWLQDDAARRYGPGLASWLLAIPTLSPSSGAVPWIDIITDEQAVGLDSDEAAADVDEQLSAGEVEASTSYLIDHSIDAWRLKTARRRWALKAAAVAPSLSVTSRLLVLRVFLAFWTAGNWSDGDPEPFTLARDLIRTLIPDREPAELADRAAALAAIALTVMWQRTDVTVSTEQTLRFNEARADARPLLRFAGDDTIGAYVAGLRTANGGALSAGHVTEMLEDMLSDDPLAELEAVVESKGFTIHRPSPTSIHIHKAGGNAELSALEAVGFAQDHDGIVVWATTEAGGWACVAWRAPDLVSVSNFGPTQRWRHQHLRPATAAAALADAIRSGEGIAGLPAVVNKPGYRRTPEAEAVLIALGVQVPHEPPCCSRSDDFLSTEH